MFSMDVDEELVRVLQDSLDFQYCVLWKEKSFSICFVVFK